MESITVRQQVQRFYELNDVERISEREAWRRFCHGRVPYNRDWAKKNPEKLRAWASRRKALAASLPATLLPEQWQAILEEYDYKCVYCGRGDLPLVQEHAIPASRGGGYTAENIVPACQPCNSRKGTKTREEYEVQLCPKKSNP